MCQFCESNDEGTFNSMLTKHILRTKSQSGVFFFSQIVSYLFFRVSISIHVGHIGNFNFGICPASEPMKLMNKVEQIPYVVMNLLNYALIICISSFVHFFLVENEIYDVV